MGTNPATLEEALEQLRLLKKTYRQDYQHIIEAKILRCELAEAKQRIDELETQLELLKMGIGA